jgi:probable rRNA maturation factor
MPVNVQIATDIEVPHTREIVKWAQLALRSHTEAIEITVRVVGDAEGCELNERWRNGSGPTNVLAFPIDEIDVKPQLRGDVVICASVADAEAVRDGKPKDAHWAHLVVHGTLHLLGYDHLIDRDAKIMEAQECTLLEELGYPDPYL